MYLVGGKSLLGMIGMNGNINEFIRNGVEIAVRNSYYFQEEGVKDFEIVAMDFIDDQYNIIPQNGKENFRMLVLVKHAETGHLNNYTAFTVVSNPYWWTMDAMYDGGAVIHDGEIWYHDICYGALTKEKADAWLMGCTDAVMEVE